MKKIWVELDIRENDDSITCYSGQVAAEDMDALVQGQLAGDFLKLDNVFWTTSSDEEDEEWKGDEEELVQYGEGDYDRYQGSIYIRKDCIIEIHVLKGGPDLLGM